jgi:hypothetical protein
MQIRVEISLGMIVLVAGGLSACAESGGLRMPAAESAIYPPAIFAHRVESSHVAIYWNCERPEPGVLRVQGVAHNPWSQQDVRFLELDLVGVDAREQSVSQASTALADYLLRTNQISPFQLDLRTQGTEVRFDLYYRYRFQDNGGRLLAGPLVDAPRMLAQPTIQFMARDICSETQHRVR